MGDYGKSASGRARTSTEIFTPEWCVRKMCDMLEEEAAAAGEDLIRSAASGGPPSPTGEGLGKDVFAPGTTFLEPACGDGNFVVEILRRKFDNCRTRSDFTTALGSVYGLEIQADNVAECIRRVTALCQQYFKPTRAELQIINDHYIMCDSLKVMRMMADGNLQFGADQGTTG